MNIHQEDMEYRFYQYFVFTFPGFGGRWFTQHDMPPVPLPAREVLRLPEEV